MHHPNPRTRRRAAFAVAVATASAVLISGVPVATASAAQSPAACENAAIVNGSFETPLVAANTWASFNESAVSPWFTTASDNKIEIWRAPFQDVPAAAGAQFAEINANQRSMLYQDVATTPGETVRWQVQHRGRTGVDTMQVVVGAPDGTLAPHSTVSTGQNWSTYSGLYTVPAGQTTTRFGFDSISSANGNATYGNFIDDVSVTSGACVITSKSVSTSSGSTPIRLGEALEYTIVATNEGASDATLASVVDPLPIGLSLVPGSIAVTEGVATTTVTDVAGDDTGEFDAASREVRVRVGAGATSSLGGTLAAGASVTVTFTAVVDSIAALPSVANTATALLTDSLTGIAEVSTSNTTATTVAPDAPALSIVTSGTVAPVENQTAAALSNTIAWSYVVANTGDVALTDVTVVDPEGGTVTCVPSTLLVGESAACTASTGHTVTQSDLVAGSVSNGATARATPPFGAAPIDSLESVATVATVAIAPAIDVSVTYDNLNASAPGEPAAAGDELRARYLVTNTGNHTLDQLIITDPMFGDVTCADVTLEPGQSTTCEADGSYVVTDDDAAAGTIACTVTASAVAGSGVTTTTVSDEQLVTLDVAVDLPTLALPEPEPPVLASTGADVVGPLALALALVGLGVLALGAVRLAGVRRFR